MANKQEELNNIFDNEAPILGDFGVEQIKIYPYEIYKQFHPKFIEPNAVSIVRINQDGIKTENTDDVGLKYFNGIVLKSSGAVLDNTTSTSAYGKVLKEEATLRVLTNYFPHLERENLKVGNVELKPLIYFIGEPYNKTKFDSGEQQGFIVSSVTSPKDYNENDNVFGKEGFTEFSLFNIGALEKEYDNCKIILTNDKTYGEDSYTYGDNTGFELGFAPHGLLAIDGVKAYGVVKEVDTASQTILRTSTSSIDLIADDGFAPFKFTPVDTNQKLTMSADWFNFDIVMPYFWAKKFLNGDTLNSLLTNQNDLELVEDMIIISYGFSTSWSDVPVITQADTVGGATPQYSANDLGKYKPDFRIGHGGYKVISLIDKDPLSVINGIYEKHIRSDPTFLLDRDRIRKVSTIIVALSRYIYSSHSLGKGNNSFNQIYLPWFLELTSSNALHFKYKGQVKNNDAGATGSVDSWLLYNKNETAQIPKFILKSMYFTNEFGKLGKINSPSSGINLPSNIDVSNKKILQTDRKTTTITTPFALSEISAFNLPGDIPLDSDVPLSYIWWMRAENISMFRKIMQEEETHSTTTAGVDKSVLIPPTDWGVFYSPAKLEEELKKAQPNSIIKTLPVITKETYNGNFLRINGATGVTGDNLFVDNVSLHFGPDRTDVVSLPLSMFFDSAYNRHTDDEIKQRFIEYSFFNLSRKLDPDALDLIINDLTVDFMDITMRIKREVFGTAIMTTTKTSIDTTIENKQILWDKDQWSNYIYAVEVAQNNNQVLAFKTQDNERIDSIQEITIQGIWLDEIELHVGTHSSRKIIIPWFGKDDETVCYQKIIFV